MTTLEGSYQVGNYDLLERMQETHNVPRHYNYKKCLSKSIHVHYTTYWVPLSG